MGRSDNCFLITGSGGGVGGLEAQTCPFHMHRHEPREAVQVLSWDDFAQTESALLCAAPTTCQALFLGPALVELSKSAKMRGDPAWDQTRVAAEVGQILHIFLRKETGFAVGLDVV